MTAEHVIILAFMITLGLILWGLKTDKGDKK